MTTDEDVLRRERRGAVEILTIMRPKRRNAMDDVLINALRAAFLDIERDEAIAAIVLNGTEPGFCAGSDLKFIGGLDLESMCRFEQETGDVARLIGFMTKPVVAAVEGFAMGGGFILATSCDVVVAARGSRWNLPEVPIGWLTPWGIKSLVARVGFVRARNLCFGLETLSGEEAVAFGVADHSAADGTALQTALQLAERLAALPRPAVSATKRFFSRFIMADSEMMDFEANRLFAENCREPVARATLTKSGRPALSPV
ncbi:MAG: enoyl-CoA hydratase/isomerase family protein [Methylobacteriaceae bacterium]|nr:enoyl-CoA hydratase/isomerase family protein [Methylobacteriaceae bacterium]